MNEPVIMGKQQLDDYRYSTATYPGSKVGGLNNVLYLVLLLLFCLPHCCFCMVFTALGVWVLVPVAQPRK